MRRAARTDANHQAVVAALRRVGATVLSLAAVGKGCPDLVAGFRGINTRLTVAEQDFLDTWAGHAVVVTSPEEAVRVVIESGRPAEARS